MQSHEFRMVGNPEGKGFSQSAAGELQSAAMTT
jgi:hypothetical protein